MIDTKLQKHLKKIFPNYDTRYHDALVNAFIKYQLACDEHNWWKSRGVSLNKPYPKPENYI